MDFMADPVHIQFIRPNIVEFLNGKYGWAVCIRSFGRAERQETPEDWVSLIVTGGVQSMRSSKPIVSSGLWVGLLGYSQCKPNELEVVVIETGTRLSTEAAGVLLWLKLGNSRLARGVARAGSCCSSFHVKCFFQTIRPAGLSSGMAGGSSGSSGARLDKGWQGSWSISMSTEIWKPSVIRKIFRNIKIHLFIVMSIRSLSHRF